MSTPSPSQEAGSLRIGWKEYLDLPALGLRRLKGKIDTGARTSTLHVHSVTYLQRVPPPAAPGPPSSP